MVIFNKIFQKMDKNKNKNVGGASYKTTCSKWKLLEELYIIIL